MTENVCANSAEFSRNLFGTLHGLSKDTPVMQLKALCRTMHIVLTPQVMNELTAYIGSVCRYQITGSEVEQCAFDVFRNLMRNFDINPCTFSDIAQSFTPRAQKFLEANVGQVLRKSLGAQ